VERHVTLLSILVGLWGAMAILLGVSMLLLAAGALALTIDPEAEAVGLAAGITAGAFALIGSFSLVWGAVHIWSAMLLKQRRPFGRILTLGLSVPNLLVLPFGTALGGYALWILLTNEARHLFEPTTATVH
jgi:hypothetical protein